jgi:hypothetical protein
MLTWPAVLAAFLVCHLAGDFLLQTEWQALTKVQGLVTPEGRRALRNHATTYTLTFLPVLVWLARDRSVLGAIGIAALIAVPHLIVDDGRLVARWMTSVKHAPDAAPWLRLMVDQSFHVLCLLGAALLAAS